jgi:hypothetical protein
MSKPPDDYTVGFGRPPQDHRWKKGQTGNPRRRKARRPKSLKAIVDDYLDSEISISENGRRRRCLRFEAIFLQIQVKALAGHKGAMSVLLDYVEFSREGEGGGKVEFRPTPEYALVLAARGDPRGSQ